MDYVIKATSCDTHAHTQPFAPCQGNYGFNGSQYFSLTSFSRNVSSIDTVCWIEVVSGNCLEHFSPLLCLPNSIRLYVICVNIGVYSYTHRNTLAKL